MKDVVNYENEAAKNAEKRKNMCFVLMYNTTLLLYHFYFLMLYTNKFLVQKMRDDGKDEHDIKMQENLLEVSSVSVLSV